MPSQVRRDIPAPPRPKLSELREQFGTIADELDAVTDRLAALEATTPTTGGGGASTMFDVPHYLRMVDGASEAAQPGDYTVGIALVALQPVTVKGVRLYWPHQSVATIRATLYYAPEGAPPELLREATEEVGETSTTSIIFATTANITAGQRVIVACWSNDDKHANMQNVSQLLPPRPVFIGPWLSKDPVKWAAGDNPPTNTGTTYQHATCWPLS